MKSRIVLFFIVVILIKAVYVLACGPYFPNSYLIGGNEYKVLVMPEASFYHELQKMAGLEKKEKVLYFSFHDDETSKRWQRTVKADLSDLDEALKKSDIEAKTQAEIMQRYEIMRQTMKEFNIKAYQTFLDSIPKEFSLYALGAVAYQIQDYKTAIKHWETLLALPKEQRFYRSTWASFMIGKALTFVDPAKSAVFFEQTRTLANNGFHDSLNLALASLGWQALVEEKQGDRISAMHRYFEQFKIIIQPEHSIGYTSLRFLCSLIFSKENELDNKLIKDDLCRQILTAWVIAHPRDSKKNKRWLSTITEAKGKEPILGADRLAWASYNLGNMELVQEWLSLIDIDSSYGKWVKAKLLLRKGEIDEAVKILKLLVSEFPKNEKWHTLGEKVVPCNKAYGDLGVLVLGRQNYAQALDAFLRGGYWMDAAYVAERVLTVEELEAYLIQYKDDNELNEKPKRGNSPLKNLRYLLARRYARLRNWDKAREYYPQKTKEIFDKFIKHLKQGENIIKSNRVRAKDLFEAAKLVRKYGMEMVGTEVEPDWTVFDGLFELNGATEYRIKDESRQVDKVLPAILKETLSASLDEKKQVAKHIISPNKRFHYRYYAASLMWRCAELLPNNDELTALALYKGGTYLMKRDPKEADRFYKALVIRCKELPIGQEANKLRWFPEEFSPYSEEG